MYFLAFCPHCKQKVGSVTSIMADADLDRVLENDGDVEVVHLATGTPDHTWRLNQEEKAILKKCRAESRTALRGLKVAS